MFNLNQDYRRIAWIKILVALMAIGIYSSRNMTVPTVTINELSEAIQTSTEERTKNVLIGILNDYMDLMYGKTTPYTTGQVVLPNGSSIQDVDHCVSRSSDQKFKDIFVKISTTFKSGDLTPQSLNGDNGNQWDPALKPVLVVVRPNP